MNENSNHFALIDRLATGELDDVERRDLFGWLDGEPSRWRRCALALLEARELEQAFDDWRAEVPRPAVQPAPTLVAHRLRWAGAFALAASLMFAFTLGTVTPGLWNPAGLMIVESPKPSTREASSQPTAKASHVVAEQPGTTPDQGVTTVAAAVPTEMQSDLFPPYVRSQLERRGYQVKSHHALLQVVLPDGRRLTRPVDELQVNYVGRRSY